MVKSSFSSGTDIHSRAFSNRFQTFKNGDVAGVIGVLDHEAPFLEKRSNRL
jgi:hypothetical protein